MSKKVKVLLVVLLIFVCLIGGYFLYKNFLYKKVNLSWFHKKENASETIKTDPSKDPNNTIPSTLDKNMVIYKIDSESITQGDIDNEISKLTPPDFEKQMESLPENDQKVYRSQIRENAIKNLTTQAFIRLYLRDQKITITQADIDKTRKNMENMIKQNFEKANPGMPFVLEDQLKQFGVTMESFMIDINNQTFFDAATAPFLSKITSVSETEMKDYFNANKDKYIEFAKADLKHILVSSEAEADSIINQLKKGANFEELAIKNSKDPEVSKNSGKIGWVPKNYMPDSMAKIIFDPSTKISVPYKIQVKIQWYVVVVLGFQPEIKKTYEQVKTQVKDDCLQEKRMRVLDDFFKKQEAKYGKPVLQIPKPKK